MKRKSKGQEVTQKPMNFRIDRENDAWLDDQSRALDVAKGRLLNNIIADRRNGTEPSSRRWATIRGEVMRIRETIKEAVIRLYAAIEAYENTDEDETPDSIDKYYDERP